MAFNQLLQKSLYSMGDNYPLTFLATLDNFYPVMLAENFPGTYRYLSTSISTIHIFWQIYFTVFNIFREKSLL